MLKVYVNDGTGPRPAELAEGAPAPAQAIWFDLLEPTPDEKALVQTATGLDIPTREEMQEIEASSRLYREANALFMTATILWKTDTEHPESAAVTFILTGDRLVTLRYADPRAFAAYAARLQRAGAGAGGTTVLAGLLEALIDRAADILERLGAEVDKISREVFENPGRRPTKARDFRNVLRRIGREGDLATKARESLLSIGRLLGFLSQAGDEDGLARDIGARVATMSRDVRSLTDHASFLSNKINFVLDATLGMINIEQNSIIKIFSVMAVVFLPPTLIASIYGMNFEWMPELGWPFGYPLALVVMILAAVLPYLYFKRKGWL